MFNQRLGFCRHVPFQLCNRVMDRYNEYQVLEAHAISETIRVSCWNHARVY
jgi:hypothetical protein